MPSLYMIEQEIMACCDCETGEIIDPERLDALLMERSQKIENVALWVKNLQADALAFKAEKETFEKREKAATLKANALKEWLAKALDGEKFSTTKCAVSFRKSTKLEVLDADSVPKEFMVETVTVKPDANAIKAVLKTGQEVNGCRLIESLNTQIK